MLARMRRRGWQWMLRHHRPRTGEVQLEPGRVYVLPTRAGLGFAAVLLLMLVTSINYALALGHAITFLVVSIGLVALLHTFRNLVGLGLRAGRADPVFAGEPVVLQIVIRNRSRLARYAIDIEAPGIARPQPADAPAGVEQPVQLALPATRRGWLTAPRFTLRTTYPLGIWQCWSWWHPAVRILVYPRPETPAVPLPQDAAPTGEAGTGGAGGEDFSALRAYREGDTPRQIAWTAVARSASGELLTKQFDGGARGELWLDWQALPSRIDAELRIERLTRWVLDAEAQGVRYGLRLPGAVLAPDRGAVHRARCLEALSLAEV